MTATSAPPASSARSHAFEPIIATPQAHRSESGSLGTAHYSAVAIMEEHLPKWWGTEEGNRASDGHASNGDF